MDYLQSHKERPVNQEKFVRYIMDNDPYFSNSEYLCLISMKYPSDPVRIKGKNALYERSELEKWLEQKGSSPYSRKTTSLWKIKSDQSFTKPGRDRIMAYIYEIEDLENLH